MQQFEAFNNTDLDEAKSPGYFESYSTTIVNNIQICISNIYIRYEDTISSSDAFAVGISLKELTVQTCNKDWIPKYVSEGDFCYKLIKINSFQCFCDYNVDIVKFQESYAGDLDAAFIKLATEDLAGQIQHNFILKPFTSYLKIVMDTKPNNFLNPKFDVEFESQALVFDFYSGQIKLFFKFGEFMKLYNEFKAGIQKNIEETEFDETTDRYYIDNYLT